MKWNRTIDKVPNDNQEVLICVDGVNYIAKFDANRKRFKVDELLETAFRVDKKELFWTSYKRPTIR
jgi:hypothetical protein